jgi:hypothetical protein
MKIVKGGVRQKVCQKVLTKSRAADIMRALVSLINFRPETVLFRLGCVNLRARLCDG